MEMHLDILRVIQEGEEKPTRIMSKSNMTWLQLQQGLEFLLENNLITEKVTNERPFRKEDKRTKNRYLLSEKGTSVLRYFRNELSQVNNLISSI
ncbi:MAG: winged helix-turn-helix domain-containing protein [Candidatus Bathyarchaeota archaeon]|nr:winged helix-turn-helix domain-containing protein [Candidatus Bathyarchaeota archaeon]